MLKRVAYAMSVPWAVIAVVLFVALGMPNGGRAGGYALLGFMFVPTVVVALVSVLLASSRRVVCACGWSQDYPAGASSGAPPAND